MIRKVALVGSALILLGCGGGGESKVTITATAGVGGSVTPASQHIAKGSTASFTIQPDTIYDIQSVSGCGGTLTGNTYSAKNVKSDCSVTASFKLKPLSMTVSALPQSVSEKTDVLIEIPVANVKGGINLTMLATNNNAVSSATITKTTDTSFIITTAEVDRDLSLEFNIILQDGDDTTRVLEKTIAITVENVSFTETLEKIKLLQSQRERLIGATEEISLIAAMREITAMLHSETNTVNTSASQNDSLATELAGAIDDIRLTDYENGSLADLELISAYNDALTVLDQYMSSHRLVLNQQLAFLAGSVAMPVQANQLILTPTLNTVSFFIGNPEFGQIVEGEFLFNDNLAYLSGLLAPTCN